MFCRQNQQFWLWSILANALGKLLGLGVIVAIAVGLLITTGEPIGAASSLGFAALMVLLSQSSMMRWRHPQRIKRGR